MENIHFTPYFYPMIEIASFVFNDFQENTYVLWDHTKECIIVDPGCYASEEKYKLNQFITERKLKPVKLINTHCHIDHILGNAYVASTYHIPLYLHKDELKTYSQTARWGEMFGLVAGDIPENQIYLTEADKITFGESTLDIAFTPGHSIASLSFYSMQNKLALVGDVLFYESIGRTDLPGGNMETLISSIKNKLFVWEDDMRIYSGHGPQTTIGHEKKYNPFLQ